jgi:diadenosine tetraphosphate (Ap4A) HIT family hydrolase
VGESAEEIYRRVQAAVGADGRLPMPAVDEWETFPFEGDIRTRPLQAPADEPARAGEGGLACWRCERGDTEAIWSDERWLLSPFPKPSGLPVIVLLEPRNHVDLGDLSPEQAAELGQLVVRVERAIMQVDGMGRVHVGRWGEGSAHLHVWFIGRPARLLQLRSSFAAIWDDVLPPTPEDVWRDNLATVARAMAAGGRRAHL